MAQIDGHAPIVVTDYLQHAARRLVPEDLRIATASLMDQITDWARANHSIAIVLSSTARSFHGDNSGKSATDLSWLARNGQVEYDAARVFFLDCDVCPPGGTAAARLHVAKSRFQGTGATIGLRFDGAYGEFTCDKASALSPDQNRIVQAVEAGAETVEEVRKAVGLRKAEVLSALRYLQGIRVIHSTPYRVIPEADR